MTKKSAIYVTQPHLPPLEEFLPYLQEIWHSKQLTNGGPFHQQLEADLCTYLGVKHISLFANGTLSLMVALKALKITGEVITTPYSFVATAHSLLWNNIQPVFIDIDPHTLNLNPARIEAAITPRTTAIMPVHCYGYPCDVENIQRIADQYQLKVIYDAAHAFGIKHKEHSVLTYGDLSVLSFHATKIFNTFEGGAIVCPNADMKRTIDYLKNFGFEDEVTVSTLGINGKMNEIQAAFGLLQLAHLDDALLQRKRVDTIYRESLSDVQGIQFAQPSDKNSANYSYFPILVEANYPMSRDALYHLLRENNIYARRYFYPLISDMLVYKHSLIESPKLPIATQIANKIVCLPIYPKLLCEEQQRIIKIIRGI